MNNNLFLDKIISYPYPSFFFFFLKKSKPYLTKYQRLIFILYASKAKYLGVFVIKIGKAIEFLIQYRAPKNIREFEAIIGSIFRKKILALGSENLDSEILFPYNARFSSEEQTVILTNAKRVAKECSENKQNFYLKSFLKRIEMKENKSDSLPS